MNSHVNINVANWYKQNPGKFAFQLFSHKEKKQTESDKNSLHFWEWQTPPVNNKEIQVKSNTL